jgi:hypothetical protein
MALMRMKDWKSTAHLLTASAVFLTLGITQAETITPDWSLTESEGFKSKSLALGAIFQIQIDGRSFVRVPGKDIEKPADDKESKPGPPKLTETFDGKPISVKRETLYDASRQVLRILDVLTNADASERNVRIYYNTSLSNRGSVTFGGVLSDNGENRENGNGVPDNTVAAIVLAELKGSQALPLFIWGQGDAKWPVSISDISSSVRLSYEGVIPRGGKIALVHYIATAGLDPKVKLERTFDLFLKEGRLINHGVPDDIVPLIVNFKPEAFSGPSAEPAAQAVPKLAALDLVCEKLNLKRTSEDQLWLGKDEHLNGTFSSGDVSLNRDGKTQKLTLASIAAVRGGGGRGQPHRLWLRDGSVLGGQVSLDKGTLDSPAGKVALDIEALEFLLLSTKPEDGKVPFSATSLIQTMNGEHLWLEQAPFASLEMVTAFGKLKLNAGLRLVARQMEPPFATVAKLQDGTELTGVLCEPLWTCKSTHGNSIMIPASSVVQWATTKHLESAADSNAEPVSYAMLRDRSKLAGWPTDEAVQINSNNRPITVKLAEVSEMKFERGEVTLKLLSSDVVKGTVLSPSLQWIIAGQSVNVPTSLLLEMKRQTPTAQ